MKDAIGRRLYHYAHCNMRLRHRYGIEMSLEEFDALSALFRSKKVPDTRIDSVGNVEGWVKLRETWICVSYRPGLQMIGTVMPAPPPAVFNEVMEQVKTRAPPAPAKPPQKEPKEDKIKRAARLLMEQAMEAGKKPRWLRSEGEIVPPVPVVTAPTVPPQVKLVDVAWYKRKIGIAGDLLKKGKAFEAALLLRAVAGLPRSARPGQAPEEAERLVEADMASERENLAQRFTEQQLTIRTPDDTTGP